MSPSPQRNRSAFGIVELLVVVAIIAFLMALLLPAVQRAREQAAAQRTVNKLKEMALATHSCNDVYRRLPPAFDKFGIFMFPAAYHVHILPYLEQDALYKAFNMQKGGGDLKEVVVITFSSVEDPSSADKKVPGIQNFPVNLRIVSDEGFHKGIDAKSTPQNPLFQPIKVAAVMSGSANIPRTFIDGTSNTILFSTKFGTCGEGGSRYYAEPDSKFAAFFGQNPAEKPAHASDAKATFQLFPDPKKECLTTPLMAQSFHKNLIEVALGDGSVRRISSTLSAETWNRAMQPNEGAQLGRDWND